MLLDEEDDTPQRHPSSPWVLLNRSPEWQSLGPGCHGTAFLGDFGLDKNPILLLDVKRLLTCRRVDYYRKQCYK